MRTPLQQWHTCIATAKVYMQDLLQNCNNSSVNAGIVTEKHLPYSTFIQDFHIMLYVAIIRQLNFVKCFHIVARYLWGVI